MLINVMINGTTKYLDDGTPYVEGGELAIMDSDELQKKEYIKETEKEVAHAIEYWDGDQLRHRSVDLILKQPLKLQATQAKFNG